MKRLLARAAASAALLLILLTVLGAPRLGRWLVREDPLAKADAIFVLGGSRFERPLEAVDLYKAGWAPMILLTSPVLDWGEAWLIQQRIPFTSDLQVQIDLMRRLGVPASAIESLDEAAAATAYEANALLARMTARRWTTVIVVTSKQHTRRAGLAMRRVVGSRGTIIVRASRYDREDVDRWWANRSTLRFTLFETQRLIAYWLGVAD